jgi:hypothetical protein
MPLYDGSKNDRKKQYNEDFWMTMLPDINKLYSQKAKLMVIFT